MYNTGIASAISLRTRGSFSFATNEHSSCSNGRSRFAYSSSTPCCSCCCNSVYCVPLCPIYGSNLYGLKQSSLVQWSCYRRPISCGFDYYARLPDCGVDRVSYGDKVCKFGEMSVGRARRRGLRKYFAYEEMNDRYNVGGFDEAEAVLSLLSEDMGKECFIETKETRRLVRKPVVEKRENSNVCRECGSKKNRFEVGDLESEHGSMVRSRMDDSRRRKERIRTEENEQAILEKEHKLTLLKSRREEREREREREEREALMRKARLKAEEKQEMELMRKENLKLKEEMEELLRREHRQTERKDRLRTEEKEELSRREENRQKLRRDGSSCSSYYSFSSNGDYKNGDEVELTEGNYLEDSSIGLKRTNNELVYQQSREEDQRHENYREDHRSSLANRSSSKEFHTGSGVVESDFRKKSEKRLADLSVEEIESRKETSLKESASIMTYERSNKKSSDYVSYDDREEKVSENINFYEEKKQQLRQGEDSRQSENMLKHKQFAGSQGIRIRNDIDTAGSQLRQGEDSRQSENMLKHKQFAGSQGIRTRNDIDTAGSQKVYTRKGEMSSKVSGSNQVLGSREDEYLKNSRKVSEVSEIHEVDTRKSSISEQHFETNVRRDDYSTAIIGSSDNTEHLQEYDQMSSQVELRGKSQQLIKKDNESSLKREAGELAKQDENVILASTSSSESKKPHSLLHAKVTKSGSSRNESDEMNKVIATHSGNAGVIRLDGRNKNKSEISIRPPPEAGQISLGSTAEISIDDAGNGSLQLDSTTLHGSDMQVSVETHPEDAIGSAARLEKSSTHYVGEFVQQVKSEVLISETQREKETYTTKILHEKSSGDSRSNERELVRNNQQSGTQGPADEMWNVDEQPIQEPLEVEVQENARKDSDVIVKRTGRSLWNIIGDIARLRWSHSESHSSSRRTGGRSSPNQSTSSEKWFSGHEAEENEEAIEEIEGRRDASSSLVTQEMSLIPSITYVPTSGEVSGDTSSAAIVESSIPSPAIRLQKSPAVRVAREAGETHTSSSGTSEQVQTGSVEQIESVVNEGDVKLKKLRRKDQVVRERFEEWEEAYRLEAEQRKIDETFMREALLEAQKAADNWEVPVGAVLVHNGEIIARGCNLVEELRDSTAHAEIICIRGASNKLRSWRLSETTLYVTLEPCPMCAGAILQARIDTLVWGAPNKLLGADGSWIRLFPGDGGNGPEITDKPPAPVHPFHPNMRIRRGVLSSECADAMQQFFKRRRKKDKKEADTSPKPPSFLPVSNRPSHFMAKLHDTFSLMFCL